jgi:hypothetical protein
LLPDSELFFGWTVTTPFPLAVRPVFDELVLAGRFASNVPHTLIPSPAYQVCDVVGGPDEEVDLWVS